MKLANYLDEILLNKKQEVERLLEKVKADPKHPLNNMVEPKNLVRKHFANALTGVDLSVIAEVKRKSPSRGEIEKIEDPVELAMKYCNGGASAISVLTDSKYFGGSLDDLKQVANAVAVEYPHVSVLRKDFIIHPIQLAEARLAGANAVLLIANTLGVNLKAFIREANRLGLETLTEVHNSEELELAINADAPIIGINHRNLSTFDVDLSISGLLKSKIPPHIITVAESGIHNPLEAKRMKEIGFDAILVGESLVRSKDPSNLIQQMKGPDYEN